MYIANQTTVIPLKWNFITGWNLMLNTSLNPSFSISVLEEIMDEVHLTPKPGTLKQTV